MGRWKRPPSHDMDREVPMMEAAAVSEWYTREDVFSSVAYSQPSDIQGGSSGQGQPLVDIKIRVAL